MSTLNHIILTDAGYLAGLGCGRAGWATSDNETNDFLELAARADERGISVWTRKVDLKYSCH